MEGIGRKREEEKQRWLITGTGGFLGARLAAYYGEKHEIVGVGRKDLDITDEAAVLAFVEAVRPDAVIHCAAISNTGTCQKDPEQSEMVNVRGTVNLAKACRRADSRLIFMSSDQVYAGNLKQEPGKEDETPEPVNVYGKHKKQAEEEAMAVLPDTVCLRLPWMYDFPVRGLKSSGGLLGILTKALIQNLPVSLPIHDYRGITWGMEVVMRMEQAAFLPAGVYNFGGENSLSTYETARAVLPLLLDGRERDGLLIPDTERFAGQPRNLRMNTEKLKNCGIEFPDAVESFCRCFAECPEYMTGMIR